MRSLDFEIKFTKKWNLASVQEKCLGLRLHLKSLGSPLRWLCGQASCSAPQVAVTWSGKFATRANGSHLTSINLRRLRGCLFCNAVNCCQAWKKSINIWFRTAEKPRPDLYDFRVEVTLGSVQATFRAVAFRAWFCCLLLLTVRLKAWKAEAENQRFRFPLKDFWQAPSNWTLEDDKVEMNPQHPSSLE